MFLSFLKFCFFNQTQGSYSLWKMHAAKGFKVLSLHPHSNNEGYTIFIPIRNKETEFTKTKPPTHVTLVVSDEAGTQTLGT